jgi:ubiquinone biosynthesis protein COQ9
MKQIVIPYSPRQIQNFLHEKCDTNRFNVVIVHRRGGKTVFAINHLIRAALQAVNPILDTLSSLRSDCRERVQHGII